MKSKIPMISRLQAREPKILGLAAGLFLVLVLIIWWLWPAGQNMSDNFRPPVLVEAEPVSFGPISRRVSTNGTLTAAQSVVLYPEVDGRIAKIFFRQGEEVRKGDLLISLDDSAAQARMQEAQAQLSVVKNNYARAKQLFDKNFGHKAAVEKAAAEVQVQEAQLKVAQVNLAQTLIKAPFDGVVGMQNINEGGTVTRNQELLTIVNTQSLYVDFPVPDSYLKNLKKGDLVDVVVEGFDSLPMECEIVAIDPKADPATHSIQVRASLENTTGELKPGQFARVTVELGQEENALVIPIVAVEKETDSNFVFIVVEGVAVLTEVTLGMREGGVVQVTDNSLKKGDLVVTAGQMKLSDGAPVRVLTPEDRLKQNDGKSSAQQEEKTWFARLFGW